MHLSYWVFEVFSLRTSIWRKSIGFLLNYHIRSYSVSLLWLTETNIQMDAIFFRLDWIQISKERRDSIKPRQDKPIQVIYMLDVILFMQIREAQWVLNEPVNIPSLNVKAFHWKYRNVLLLAVNVCHRFIWVWIEWY